jgi:hypothetical protein
MIRQPPDCYTALLRTPGGLIQKATVYADSMTQVHFTIRELWPGLRVVRIAKEGEW